jgi:hypothetical protein
MVIEEFWSPSHTPTPLDGDQNSSVAQQGNGGMNSCFFQNDNIGPHPFQRLKNFNSHLMVGVCRMVIEIFQLPKRGAHGISFLKKKSSSPPYPPGRLKNFNHNIMVGVCQMATEFFQSPSNTPPLFDGNQKYKCVIFWEKPS